MPHKLIFCFCWNIFHHGTYYGYSTTHAPFSRGFSTAKSQSNLLGYCFLRSTTWFADRSFAFWYSNTIHYLANNLRRFLPPHRLLYSLISQWFSFGVQYLIFILLYFFMPDYPSTNPGSFNYFFHLLSIIRLLFKHPLLVQASLIGFCTSTIFTSYWTTLTFLLSSPPYSFSPVPIGLFALLGIVTFILGPIYSRLIIDKFIPLFSVILGLLYCFIGVVIGTYTGEFTLAGPILQAIFMDLGIQTAQIANRSAIYGIDPKARNRVNTAYMLMVFSGQLTGTAVGNRLYARGGWVVSGSAGVGFVGLGLGLCFLRGPWEKGWVGWGGGWGIRRRDLRVGGVVEKRGVGERGGENVHAGAGAGNRVLEMGDGERHGEVGVVPCRVSSIRES